MTFEEWRREAEQMLMAWYCDDPASVDKDHWRQCFDCNYRPWEAARYAAELLHQRATRASFKRIICDDISEFARSQHENGYGRVIEDRPGATAKNFFSQRTCTIAPHDEKIGTASLGCRRK